MDNRDKSQHNKADEGMSITADDLIIELPLNFFNRQAVSKESAEGKAWQR